MHSACSRWSRRSLPQPVRDSAATVHFGEHDETLLTSGTPRQARPMHIMYPGMACDQSGWAHGEMPVVHESTVFPKSATPRASTSSDYRWLAVVKSGPRRIESPQFDRADAVALSGSSPRLGADVGELQVAPTSASGSLASRWGAQLRPVDPQRGSAGLSRAATWKPAVISPDSVIDS